MFKNKGQYLRNCTYRNRCGPRIPSIFPRYYHVPFFKISALSQFILPQSSVVVINFVFTVSFMYFTFEKCYRKGAIQKHVHKSPEQHNQIRHGQRKVFYYGVRAVGLLQLPQWNISHCPTGMYVTPLSETVNIRIHKGP